MSSKNINRIIELRECCKKLLELSLNMRYVCITNEFGRTLAGKMKSGLVPLLRPEEARNEFFLHSMIFNIRKSYEKSIGATELILLQSSKVNIVSFIKNGLIYYVTIERGISEDELDDIIKNIQEKLQTFN
jgi:hypothetical protein